VKIAISILATLLISTALPVRASEDMQLDGMAVIGNRELPKALFIVPWKTPEAALAPDRPLNTLVNDALQPVDPDVFRRKLEYFETVHRLD
jgi:hypothetical protein